MLKDNGIKSVIINSYIPLINSKVNEYLTIMGANYNYYLDNEFNEVIKSRGRDTFTYTSFSQGEKMRIDLSILFAFRDLVKARSGSICNLLLLDEVFDSATDSDGVTAINEILNTLDGNIMIISHSEKAKDQQFDNHYNFVKKGSFTKLS